jgi:hypothetical protein
MKFGGMAARPWLAVGGALLSAAACENSSSAPPAPSYIEDEECDEQEPPASAALLRQGLLTDAKYYACSWPKTDNGDGFSDVSLDDTAVTGVPMPVVAPFDGLPDLQGRTLLVSSDPSGFFAAPITDDGESLKGELFWNEELSTGNQTVRFAILAAESNLVTPTIGTTVSKTTYLMRVGSGDVQINLHWKIFSDLDLHVIEPDDHEIYWEDATSPSGGQLDLDSWAQCSQGEGKGNENVFWPDGMAPKGTYRVLVDLFAPCGAAFPIQYRVSIVQNRTQLTVYDRQYPEPPEGYEPITFTR